MREPNASSKQDNRTPREDEASFSLEAAYGSVDPSTQPEDWDEVSRIAKDEKAEKTVRELREQLKS